VGERHHKRSKRRLLLENLLKAGRPPLSTPQWKDALREQELRAPKRPKDC
jgi:hypothetical protein